MAQAVNSTQKCWLRSPIEAPKWVKNILSNFLGGGGEVKFAYQVLDWAP